jgi:hypothetical protein
MRSERGTGDSGVSLPRSADARAWEAAAIELQRDGYTAAVVARKLIEHHGAPVADAEQLVGRLFGRPVDAFAGETTSAIVSGLGLAALGIVGMVVVLSLFGGVYGAGVPVLGLPGGLVVLGVGRAFFAFINRHVTPAPRR